MSGSFLDEKAGHIWFTSTESWTGTQEGSVFIKTSVWKNEYLSWLRFIKFFPVYVHRNEFHQVYIFKKIVEILLCAKTWNTVALSLKAFLMFLIHL